MSEPDFRSEPSPTRLQPWLLLALAALFALLLLRTTAIPGTMQIALVAALMAGIMVKQRWMIYLALAIFLFAESARWRSGPGFQLMTEDFYLVLTLMGFAVFSLRCTDSDALNAGGRKRSGPGGVDPGDADAEKTWIALRPLTAGLSWIPISVAAAALVLWLIPIDFSADDRLRIKPVGFRAITILWFLAVSWFFLWGLFWWLADREQDCFRARVYARSAFGRELFREMHAIEKRRAKRHKQDSDPE
jgi:hypothetical protein